MKTGGKERNRRILGGVRYGTRALSSNFRGGHALAGVAQNRCSVGQRRATSLSGNARGPSQVPGYGHRSARQRSLQSQLDIGSDVTLGTGVLEGPIDNYC
jgi:hypothetical protein